MVETFGCAVHLRVMKYGGGLGCSDVREVRLNGMGGELSDVFGVQLS